ncbi:MAG: ATP-binding protein [Clostridiales bacterium]
MDIFLDKKEYDRDVFSQLENTLAFIKNHINIKSEIKRLQRKDIFEIPLEALREVIVNAVVHRDYINMGRDIKVGVYDDIVNVVSPGGYPSSITQENILDGRSEIRNRTIAKVFKELNYIEQWGTGIRRIKTSCLNSGLKEPIIKESGDFVDVEIFREMPKSAGKVPESAEKKLFINIQEEEVIDYIKKNNKITSKDTEKILNVKERRARKILSTMAEKNIIRTVGKSRARYYILSEEKINKG